MKLGRVVAVTLVLLMSACSGCTLLRHTSFIVLSTTVTDDGGFPRLSVRFNTSDLATLTVLGPDQQPLFTDEYYQGVHTENVCLAGYRTIPLSGKYTVLAKDASKNTIFQNEMVLQGQNLSIVQVQDDWWQNGSSAELVALHLTVHNAGDLPSYPYQVTAHLGEVEVQAKLTPTAILPHESATVSCFVHLGPLSSNGRIVTIIVTDGEGSVLVRTTHEISSPDPVSSWTYDWVHLGDQTLSLPAVDWLYEYFKGLSRFDLNDYAPYVYDPYDDAYV